MTRLGRTHHSPSLTIYLACLFLAACGGGGGGTEPSAPAGAQTTRVSVGSSGVQGNGSSGFELPSLDGGLTLSADGRFVAFSSDASNLVPGDTNEALDIFVHDRQTRATERVSVDSAGT